MKITVESTQQSRYSKKIIIEVSDDCIIDEAVDTVLDAIIAYGFSKKNVKDYIMTLAEQYKTEE